VSFVAKLFVIFNFILSIAFLIFAMNAWTAPTKWRAMYEQEKTVNVPKLAELQKEELKTEQEIVRQQQIVAARNKDINGLTLEKNRLRDELLARDSHISQLENKCDLAIAERQEVDNEKKRYVEDLLKLKGVLLKQQQAVTIERENATRARAEKADMETELNATKQNLAALQRDKKVIEEDLARQTRIIELALLNGYPLDKLTGVEMAAIQPAMEAQVLAVRPDVGLVMLSAGSQQGVKPGFQFTISRGDQYVSKVQVDTVYPDMCSARIMLPLQKGTIQIHDEARSR
jgi:hypothetical protein